LLAWEIHDLDSKQHPSDSFRQSFTEVVVLPVLREQLKAVEPFTHAEIEKVFNALVAEKGLKLGKIAQPVRVALTGGTVSPGIYEVIEVMGKERTIRRIEAAVRMIQK